MAEFEKWWNSAKGISAKTRENIILKNLAARAWIAALEWALNEWRSRLKITEEGARKACTEHYEELMKENDSDNQ